MGRVISQYFFLIPIVLLLFACGGDNNTTNNIAKWDTSKFDDGSKMDQ